MQLCKSICLIVSTCGIEPSTSTLGLYCEVQRYVFHACASLPVTSTLHNWHGFEFPSIQIAQFHEIRILQQQCKAWITLTFRWNETGCRPPSFTAMHMYDVQELQGSPLKASLPVVLLPQI